MELQGVTKRRIAQKNKRQMPKFGVFFGFASMGLILYPTAVVKHLIGPHLLNEMLKVP